MDIPAEESTSDSRHQADAFKIIEDKRKLDMH